MARLISLKKKDANIGRFLAFHFPDSTQGYKGTKADGCFGLYTRSPVPGNSDGLTYMKLGWSGEKSVFVQKIEQFELFPDRDYYITSNTFSNSIRSINTLFSYENIVIDIDAHRYAGDLKEAERLFHIFLESIRDDWNSGLFDRRVPDVNSVVFTGRGLQVWFKTESMSYKLEKAYCMMQEYLLERMEEFLKRDLPLYQMLQIDRPASMNQAGLFRMPGSVNQKSGTGTEVYFLSDEPVDIIAFFRDAHFKAPAAKKKAWMDYSGQDFLEEAVRYRLESVIRLREARDHQEGCEMRDLYNFVYFNSAVHIMPEDEAMDMTRAFNRGFKCPMPETELVQALSTSVRKKYRLSNKKVITLLGITDEEQETVGFPKKKERKRRRIPKISGEQENMILDLCRKGLNKKEIAKCAGVSEDTVARRLRAAGLQTEAEIIRRKMERLIKEGWSTSEIARECQVNPSTVSMAKRRIREKKNAEKEAGMKGKMDNKADVSNETRAKQKEIKKAISKELSGKRSSKTSTKKVKDTNGIIKPGISNEYGQWESMISDYSGYRRQGMSGVDAGIQLLADKKYLIVPGLINTLEYHYQRIRRAGVLEKGKKRRRQLGLTGKYEECLNIRQGRLAPAGMA